MNKLSADARAEAQAIAQKARDAIASELAAATADADAQIAAKTAESEVAINAIRESALENVQIVAKDTAAAIVTALGGKADDAEIAAAVSKQVKG